MKYIVFLIFLALVVFGGWPYVNLFRLDRALMENDQTTLAELVDLEELKSARRNKLEKQVNQSMGQSSGTIANMVRGGARWLGKTTANTIIDLDWVRNELRWSEAAQRDAYPSIISNTTFAFFESPTGFLFRIGDLGEEPIHVRMALQGWWWRVTEIHD